MKYRNLLFISLLVLSHPCSIIANEHIGRQMSVHEFDELGLIVWLETEPESIYKIVRSARKHVLRIDTPANVYPPISMTVVSFINMPLQPNEFDSVFDALLETALIQHGLNPDNIRHIAKQEAQYGELTGAEVVFQVNIHGDASDAKIFLGQGNGTGNGPDLLQAYTLAGKMSHIDGQLRRSWGNIQYMD